ncbi:hypothetical protein AJ79_01349 [Helicocarpus griseus UAMH5409]|uniref:Uncharacterized protein n=1 Tax=Helicocarpus griseus UAMH5409 TaxID=1447875 RepID=A0A2B7Y6V2_9EURO|nr:hypothetical protein AJ79_01349 [Helicocarpus griseus UAMH5409]
MAYSDHHAPFLTPYHPDLEIVISQDKGDNKKPEEKKPEEKKPDEKKPDDKKPDDRKPDGKKPDDKKSSSSDKGHQTGKDGGKHSGDKSGGKISLPKGKKPHKGSATGTGPPAALAFVGMSALVLSFLLLA